jgi:hypothetical protein
VVAKMLAKKPEDRYQTPGEVIAALAPWMGNSSRILAGISRTNLAQGADLQATLSEIARKSTKRLNEQSDEQDAEQVDVESGKETGAVATAKTTRERSKRAKPKMTKTQRLYLYIAVGIGVSLLGVLGAWAAVGSKKPSDQQVDAGNNTQPQQPEQPKGQPSKENPPKKGNTPPIVPPKTPLTKDVLVYQFEATKIAPFKVRLNGGTVLDGKKGNLPRGIGYYALNNGEAEFEVGNVDNTPVISITRTSKAGDTHIAFELERELSAQGMALKLKDNTEYKVRIRYRASGETQISLSVHSIVGYKTAGYIVFPAVVDQWATRELSVSRKDAPVRCTLAILGSVNVKLAIASVELYEVVPDK